MIVIVPNTLPLIAEYYRTYSTDNSWPGDLVFEPSKVILTPIPSFEELIRMVTRYAVDRNEKQILIVSHGSDNELKMPIVTGSRYPAASEILVPLADYVAADTGKKAGLKQFLLRDDWEVDNKKVRPFSDPKQLDRLADAIRMLQGAGLDQVHFRACNVGAGAALAALARIFGSKHTSGPTSWYLFYFRTTVDLPANGGGANFAPQVNTMSSPRRVFSRDDCLLPYSSNPPGTDAALAISTYLGSDGKPNIGQIQAVSQAAIEGWTRVLLEDSQYYPFGQKAPGNGYKRGQKLIVFGIANDDNTTPILFPGDGMPFLQKLAVVNSP